MPTFLKTQRLLHKSDFSSVFDAGAKVSVTGFLALYKANGGDCGRLGLVVAKKKVSKAHDRNRIKRIIRETFRLQSMPCVDVVVLVRDGVASYDNAVLREKLEHLWEKLAKVCLPVKAH